MALSDADKILDMLERVNTRLDTIAMKLDSMQEFEEELTTKITALELRLAQYYPRN